MLLGLCRLVILVSLLYPSAAFATQEHGGAEGLVSHELAHLFFLFATAYLLWKTASIRSYSPYIQLRRSAVFFFIWNIITFTTHILREYLHPAQFKGMLFRADNTISLLWYAGTILEHLFLVLACWYFLKTLLDLKKLFHHTEA
ncbi:MAG TPA: hypothetical protein ENK09_11370 [Nitrospirae bacterium]|nr:hypothetical protein [Nitrospirota bacterium]